MNASETVRDELIHLIQSRELRLGQRLPGELELARQFGVSRPVLREALGSLRSMGFVETRSGSGNYVASNTGKAALLLGRYTSTDLQQIRGFIEVPSAGLAAEKRSDAWLRELESIVVRLEATDDPSRWVEQDVAFHTAIAEATGNAVVPRLVENLRELLVENSLALAIADPARIEQSNAEHRRIYEAIVASNPRRARAAMKDHLERSLYPSQES
jgi:DNA-binding FadR family transcriptional regulator